MQYLYNIYYNEFVIKNSSHSEIYLINTIYISLNPRCNSKLNII